MKRIMYKLAMLIASSVTALTLAITGSTEDPANETGTVKWKRDYVAAKETSAKSGKPLLLLFQEVPG